MWIVLIGGIGMQVSLKGVCRGEDVVCALVRIRGCGDGDQLFLESFSERGGLLPSRLVVEYADADSDERVRCVALEANRGIVGNTKAGIREARGDYLCFLDPDDVIEPDALFEYARVIETHPDAAMLYCDEDKVLADGRYVDGFFKPDFNIDRLRAQDFLCHFLCVKRSVLESIELFDERHEGAQNHDLALKVSARSDKVHHVRKVLYHWQAVEGSTATAEAGSDVPKPHANDAGRIAISEHLARFGIAAEVLGGPGKRLQRRDCGLHDDPAGGFSTRSAGSTRGLRCFTTTSITASRCASGGSWSFTNLLHGSIITSRRPGETITTLPRRGAARSPRRMPCARAGGSCSRRATPSRIRISNRLMRACGSDGVKRACGVLDGESSFDLG